MDWYRIYHGLPDDPRLGVMAHRANMTRAEGLALFITLLDFASRVRRSRLASKRQKWWPRSRR